MTSTYSATAPQQVWYDRLLYYALLALSFFSIVNFLIRELIGRIPVIGSLAPGWKEGLLLVLYILWLWKSRLGHAASGAALSQSPTQSPTQLPARRTTLHTAVLVSFLIMLLATIIGRLMPATVEVEGIPTQLIPTLSITLDALRVIFEPILYALVIIALVDKEETLKWMMNTIILAATAVAAYGFYQWASGMETPTSWVYYAYEGGRIRVYSSIGNPNALGGFMVLVAPIAVSFLLAAKNWRDRILYGLATATMLATLGLTQSRGAWIGFIAGMVLYALITKNKKFLIAFVIGVIAVAVAFPELVQRLTFAFSSEYINKSKDNGRLDFWMRAFNIWKDNKFFGTGLGLVGDSVAVRHHVPGATWIDNQYVKLLAETGLFGLISYLVVLATPVLQGIKSVYSSNQKGTFLYQINAGIVAAIFGMIVENVTAAIFEDLNVATHYWVLIGFLYVGMRLAREQRTQHHATNVPK